MNKTADQTNYIEQHGTQSRNICHNIALTVISRRTVVCSGFSYNLKMLKIYAIKLLRNAIGNHDGKKEGWASERTRIHKSMLPFTQIPQETLYSFKRYYHPNNWVIFKRHIYAIYQPRGTHANNLLVNKI